MTEKTIIERVARALLARQEPSLLWDDLKKIAALCISYRKPLIAKNARNP
jgi:hypothetical protein